MTEERKRELRQLLEEAKQSLEIRLLLGDGALLSVEEYGDLLRKRWTSYSEDSLRTIGSFQLYVTNEVAKSKLLDFIRVEYAPFICEDKILSASDVMLNSGLSIDDSSHAYHLEDLLKQLLHITIVYGIKKAVSDFHRCTEETHGSVKYMVLLEGIKLRTEIQVFDGIQLVPLPNSASELPHYLPDMSPHVSRDFYLGKTVLICNCSISPIFHKPFLSTAIQEYEGQKERIFRVEINSEYFQNCKMQDFPLGVLCEILSLACSSPIQIAAAWKFLAEDELFNLNFGLGSITTWEHSPISSSTEVGEDQIEEVKCLFEKLDDIDSKDREKLRIAIDRWIMSKTNKRDVDKMIDLGIALEALYVPDSGRGEIRFKLAVRAAWHLGKDKANRDKLLKRFKQIYDCRSDAVHSGELEEMPKFGDGRIPVSDFIKKAQSLCRKSIMKVLNDECVPNLNYWNSLILGNEDEQESS